MSVTTAETDELIADLKTLIEDAREAGLEPHRAIVPSEHWDRVKELADYADEGMGEWRIDGVTMLWDNTRKSAVVEFRVSNHE